MNYNRSSQHSANDNAPVIIRLASREDTATVSAITDAAYSKYIQRLGRKPEPMTGNYVDLISKHSVYLLLIGDQPVGVLVLKYEPDQTLIWSVAIHPEHQREGLGLHLLEHAEHEALAHGNKSIRLYTNSLFVENIALYKRLGYEESRREPFLGSTVVHMTKTLKERIKKT